MHIVVESVIALSSNQKKKLADLFEKKYGSREFKEKIEPTLLGGIRVTVGSTQYDSSLFGSLTQMRNA
ncbi:MAG: hypothetical protein UX04_C0006G0079 [Microgenomates group bacterium GW2011_GWF2_45_18]|nr:MAG: hypothetical protein UW18_C0006G0079 [Microgenomates group bacterium GW2011_GWF1_44_10]KKU01544.1 MAG: hypothetical protein UX04_C0006G0079 [Microgenomates group bacterium GW2011_GWF2_45_18]HAU99452.1 hypothetical protein [Candidatus Paceibacterota bacterium]HAX01542.1 hypothetical protein [Candidatus Paceibacterota bacterium]